MKYIIALLIAAAVILTACQSVTTQDNQTTNNTQTENQTSGKTYISTDPNCSINFLCTVGHKPFKDEQGCGCEPAVETNNTQLETIQCTDPRPEMCYEIYQPVCGDVQVECIKAPCPPIKQTFANDCQACQNPRTISYTPGACEDSSAAGGTVPAGTTDEQCVNIGGTWTGYDCVGIDANQCQEIGGKFNECASACRNDPNATVCTLQCVQVCTFD